MSFRDGIKKGGGGFFTGDGTQLSYEFTKRFKGDKKDGDWVYFVPTVQLDGADKTIDQHMFVGGSDTFEVSDDGQELTMADESPVTFGGNTPFGRYIDTATEKDTDDLFTSELPDIGAGEAMNLTALNGQRFRYEQEVDVKGTEKRGPKKVKNKRTGKMVEYPRTNTVIAAVLGEAAKSSTKGSTKPSGSKKKGAEDDPDDEDAVAAKALEILEAALSNGPVMRKSLSLPVTKALLQMAKTNKPFAEAVKAKALDEDFQDEQDQITEKKGQLSWSE